MNTLQELYDALSVAIKERDLEAVSIYSAAIQHLSHV